MGSAASKPAVNVVKPVDEKRSVSSNPSSLHISSPKSVDGSLTLSNVSAWESATSTDPKLQLARTILSHSDIRSALQSRSAHIADVHVFNTELDFKTTPVTDQKSTGRCWLFATTNVLRYDIMKKLKLKEFQLSQVIAQTKLILTWKITEIFFPAILVLLGQAEQVQLLFGTFDRACRPSNRRSSYQSPLRRPHQRWRPI